MRIDVRHNFPEVQRKLASLRQDLRDKVMAAALNKVADGAKVEAVRAVVDEYVIKASDIRPRIYVRRASARGARLVAEVEAFGRRRGGRSMNIIHFLERSVSLAEAKRRRKAGTLQQLRFRIKRGSGLKTIEGAFLGNEGRTVFRRKGKARLPIEAVQVIDLPQMFTSRKINQRVVGRIARDYPVEVERAIRAALARYLR